MYISYSNWDPVACMKTIIVRHRMIVILTVTLEKNYSLLLIPIGYPLKIHEPTLIYHFDTL